MRDLDAEDLLAGVGWVSKRTRPTAVEGRAGADVGLGDGGSSPSTTGIAPAARTWPTVVSIASWSAPDRPPAHRRSRRWRARRRRRSRPRDAGPAGSWPRGSPVGRSAPRPETRSSVGGSDQSHVDARQLGRILRVAGAAVREKPGVVGLLVVACGQRSLGSITARVYALGITRRPPAESAAVGEPDLKPSRQLG